MQEDMDIDAGCVLDGTPIDALADDVLEELIAVASGKRTASEKHGFGEEEFAPWAIGPVL